MIAISKALPPKAANDNFYSERWPVWEEYQAKRLGKDVAQNERSWDCVEYVAEVWDQIRNEAEPYLAAGTFQADGASCFGNPLSLRGAERTANANGFWSKINRQTDGRFWIVKRAIVDQCEMRDLATEVPNAAKRAAAGRAKLVEALPIVAEAIRLTLMAEAA